jgi:hypothetical protein
VDHQNFTALGLTVASVLHHYEEELTSLKNGQFYSYILSLWRRTDHSLDVIIGNIIHPPLSADDKERMLIFKSFSPCHLYANLIGSSLVHVIIQASTLTQEHEATVQILSLLYLYPCLSITLIVHDVVWFIRHHYGFFRQLVDAGYVRIDPMGLSKDQSWRSSKGIC